MRPKKKVVATIPLGDNLLPTGLAVTPDGQRGVVARIQYSGANDVAIIDFKQNKVTAAIEADFYPLASRSIRTVDMPTPRDKFQGWTSTRPW